MGRTALALAVEDPMHLVVQGARRFLPRARGSWGPRRGLGGALAAFVQDRPADARRILSGVRPRARPARALRDLLAVELGVPLGPGAGRRARARAAWQRGAMTEAVELLGGTRRSRLRTRMESELGLMRPRSRLALGRATPARPAGGGVLAVLTNAQPHTNSGYTFRSQHVFDAIAASGRRVDAATRIGYPATIGRPGSAIDWRIGGVNYHRLPAFGLPAALDQRLAAQARQLVALIAEHDPAILHTTTDWTNAVATAAAADATGLPWVYEMRGLLELTWLASRPAAYREDAEHSERVRLLRAREADLASAADAVVALSMTQRADLVSRGVPADAITVIPNAVDEAVLARPPVEPADARAALGLPRAGLWVGSITSVVGYEGLDVLIDAIAAARAAGLDVRGAIVGDGVSRPELVARVDRLGLGEHVLLPGRVPHAEALRWYEALDVFAVPRRDTPVCRMVTPVKPLEAMALRRPVIGSDLPALAEIIGGAGTLARPGDPADLARALGELADPDERDRYGYAGRQLALRRTWQAAAQTYGDLYRTILGKDARS